MSEFHKGRPKPAGMGEKVSAALKGKTKSESHRASLSRAIKGRKLPPEWVEKVASKLRGKKRDPEMIERAAAKRRGRPAHPDAIARIIAYNKAHPNLSDETKAKISLALKGKKRGHYITFGTKHPPERVAKRYGDMDERSGRTEAFITGLAEHGIPYSKVADRAGIHRKALGPIVRRKNLPSITTIEKMELALLEILAREN